MTTKTILAFLGGATLLAVLSAAALTRQLGSEPPSSASRTAGPEPLDSVLDLDLDRVEPGEKVPDFVLSNQDGRPVRLGDFRGKAVVLTFIYTRCPLPDYCPLMSKNFASLQERLAKDLDGRFQLLSVSIDPEFDTPEILKSYAIRYDAQPGHWTFGTGTIEQTAVVASLFGLTYEPENGLISHDLRTALIGPDGKLVHIWKSNVWTPYEVERRVRETLAATDERSGGLTALIRPGKSLR